MEKNKRVCKICMKMHLRIYSGKWKKDTAWRDEHGLLWNGRVCGGCNRKDARERQQRSRDEKKKQDASGQNQPD